jgi:hypothetical protein
MNNTIERPPVQTDHVSIADFDLTPRGLADAPARQEDTESIVYTGNS